MRWSLVFAAAGILLITTGARQSLGLFIAPLHADTGVSLVAISFALAIGQFTWGAVQPLFGALAGRHGSTRVVVGGLLLLTGGLATAAFARSEAMLVATLGVLSAAGAGAASFAILIGAVAGRLPAARRSFAAGVINAGASLGQFVFAPIAQALIALGGWAFALLALAASTLLALPLVGALRGGSEASATAPVTGTDLRSQLVLACRDRSYVLLHVSFLTCGLHIAFLVTHLPGEVSLCGLPADVSARSIALIGLFNIAGSLAAGALGNRMPMKYLLAAMYASRALVIAVYLVAPRTPVTYYVFSALLGLSWLATVPPTAGLVGKLFGTQHLATLFGLTLLSHQVGAFFGAWLGGVALAAAGDYRWMWYADIALATLAAIACLPIREPGYARRAALT